jgi:dTDP-4-dehydrorhamnose reductase
MLCGLQAIGVVSPGGPRPAFGRTVALDLRNAERVADTLRALHPEVIVHAAAVTNLARALHDPPLAQATNVDATRHLSEFASRHSSRMVFISTDMVFDGERAPYGEADAVGPVGVYGRTKVEAEQFVLRHSQALVVRVPLLYGVPAVVRDTTFLQQVRALQAGAALTLFDDEFRTPLWLEDAAAAVIRCAQSDLDGIVHLGGPQRLSRLQMGRLLAAALGVSDAPIVAASRLSAQALEARPRDLSLQSERFMAMFGEPPGRTVEDALAASFACGSTC